MQTAIRLDALGGAIVSDGLHRLLLDGPVVAELVRMKLAALEGQAAQCGAVQARPLVVIPLAPEATALEGVQPFAGEVVDVG